MTLPERLRAAASAERLSDWVRVLFFDECEGFCHV